ncbi:MAG: hypothetical protein AAF702_44640 [Chloroflexota bacterium]
MAQVTINLISPSGAPLGLTLSPDDDSSTIMELLERADKAAQAISQRPGWAFADQRPEEPTVKELSAGPTFCGFLCSESTNPLGFPAFVMVGEKMAKRREKQGDTWYSYKTSDGQYEQVLNFRAGDEVPGVKK